MPAKGLLLDFHECMIITENDLFLSIKPFRDLLVRSRYDPLKLCLIFYFQIGYLLIAKKLQVIYVKGSCFMLTLT